MGWPTGPVRLEAHKQAPPDLNFSGRLEALPEGTSRRPASAARRTLRGFEWPPARKADSEPPYELRPGTGRRGPEHLWRRFDQAIAPTGHHGGRPGHA